MLRVLLFAIVACGCYAHAPGPGPSCSVDPSNPACLPPISDAKPPRKATQ